MKNFAASIKGKSPVMVLLIPFVILAVGFELGPLLAMIQNSFLEDDGRTFSFVQYMTVLQSKFYLTAIKNSLLISLFSATIAILLAVISAYSITRFSARVQERFLSISNMTSNFEGIPLAFSYIILLGNNGLFTLLFSKMGLDLFADFNLYSWTGLILVYVYFQIPLAILLIYPAYHGLKEEWRSASALLGATSAMYWVKIGIPVLLPAIVGTFSILFANAMGAYATAYALVGSNYNLLSLQIAALVASDVVLKPQLGSALGVFLAGTMIAAMLFNEKMMRKVRRDLK